MKRTWAILASATVLCLAAAAVAADPATKPAGPPALGEGKGQVTLTWDEFVKITGYDPARKDQQVLTIPWSDVEKLLGVELKGKVPMDKTMVDLPWRDFQALLEWSVKKKVEGETPPPTDYIVNSSRYAGEIGADDATFTLTLKLNVLRKTGWKRIPVLPANVALTETKLDDGVFLNNAGNVYELLTEKSGEINATLKFAVTVAKAAGIYTVGFDRVTAGSSVLDLSFQGEQQVDAKVAGSQSLTTVGPDKAPDKMTHVAAAIPAAVAVNITWERALPKVAAPPTKLYAETQTLVAVAEGILVCQESIDFNILHTAVRELKLVVPKGANVLEVTGRSVQDWRAEPDGQLTVIVRGEAIGPFNLRLSYEAPAAGETAAIPVVRAAGVERQKGYVGVIALTNVEIAPGAVDGASVIDVKQLPPEIPAMTKQPILLGFRYVGEKFSIPLAIKKHAEVSVLVTIADSALFTTMQLDDGRRMTRVIYTIRNNRNQFLRIAMPPRADIWSVAVGGNTVSPATDEQKNVLIPLIRSAAGAQELASFPVEVVYVETPEKAPAASGKLHVELPGLTDTPAMHVMVNYYAPKEGAYGKAGGLFAAAQSGFSGTLNLVSSFAAMTTDRAIAEVVPRDAQKQAQAMQQQFEGKMEAQALAAGATPIRVRLPIDGKLFRLEKILALPRDELRFDVDYSDWKVAK